MELREGGLGALPPPTRGRGIGTVVLDHLIGEASARGYTRLSLETGSPREFAPARRLYARRGFVECGPFGPYAADDFSVFMTLRLVAGSGAPLTSTG